MESQTEVQARAPDRIEDISAAWLSRVMDEAYPGVAVTALKVGAVIHGTATKLHLTLAYNGEGARRGLPTSLWLKTGYEPHSAIAEIADLYRSEAFFYRDLAQSLGLGCAKTYVVHIDPADQSSFFLMEDLGLRHCAFGLATHPIGPDKAAQVLEVLAGLHARHWGKKPALDWLSDGSCLERVQRWQYEDKALWDRCMALPRARYVPASMKSMELIGGTLLKMLELDRAQAHCVVHGDAHLGNTFFDPKGSAGYLDWQTVMWGCWAHDFAEFMTIAMTIDDRRHHERELMAHYLTAVARHGAPAPGFDEAWFEYRRHAIYNMAWCYCVPEWQPEEIVAPNTERAFAAAMDLDTVGAWGL